MPTFNQLTTGIRLISLRDFISNKPAGAAGYWPLVPDPSDPTNMVRAATQSVHIGVGAGEGIAVYTASSVSVEFEVVSDNAHISDSSEYAKTSSTLVTLTNTARDGTTIDLRDNTLSFHIGLHAPDEPGGNIEGDVEIRVSATAVPIDVSVPNSHEWTITEVAAPCRLSLPVDPPHRRNEFRQGTFPCS